ncbi:MAG: hypothetical protein KBI32_04460 [Phycisphaerae bacterium]|nr:hypothetical protein [Phycisphaerae bacterium]HON90923.1 hypothetical protein [Sedimentisphaerales bacterium]
MSQTERHKRLRLLLNKLNKQRKQQACKIDILCNDLISAQRAFIQRLYTIGFAAEFYKSLLGSPDLNHLLARADRMIRRELPGTGVAFYLRQSDGCDLHSFVGEEVFACEQPGPQEHLTPELIDGICKSNKICTFAEISALDPAGDYRGLRRYSIVTLPLSDLGRSLGFLLLWRPSALPVTSEDVHRIESVLCGLSQAIRGIRVSLASSE